MDLSFLPNNYLSFINQFGQDKLYEIRIRNNFPLKINYANECFLSKNFKCTSSDIKNIILSITEKSIYAFNDYIKKGFITTKDGIRIGLAGEVVQENGQVVTIKNLSSLNIRIPHQIENCSKEIFPHVFNEKMLYNSLIISPPFHGKTTILKDLALKINNLDKYSILIVDERNEFADIIGQNIDKIIYCSKEFAFNNGIRSLSPSLIITDELFESSDWNCVQNAIFSGVKVIASLHGNCLEEIINRQNFYNVFDKYIFLDNCGIPGVLKEVFNKEFNII